MGAAVLATLVLAATTVPAQDIPAAKEVLSRYVAAALANDGETVVGCISTPTFRIWDEVVDLARTADRPALERQDLYGQLTVLWIRERFSSAELEGLTGRRYVSLSYTKGFNSTLALQVVKSIIDSAPWQIREVDGGAGLFYEANGEWHRAAGLLLAWEDGQWKIDGADQYASIQKKLTDQWKSSGLSKSEFARELFHRVSGEYPDESLWKAKR